MVLIMHFATISAPKELVFDEAYYVPAANSILHGQSLGRLEHPPLGQGIIAAGIGIFGDNPWGWRFFPVMFGAVSLILFYLICRQISSSKYFAFAAVTLLAIDNLSFTQAGTAMLDVFCLTFMFAAVLIYLKNKPVWAGIFIGLAAVTKLTGVLVLPFILLYWLITNRKSIKMEFTTIITSAVTFLGSLFLLDAAILHHFDNPFSRINYMLTFAKNLTFPFNSANSHPLSVAIPSRPWEWLYRLQISYDKITHIWSGFYDAVINPGIWILIIPIFLFLLLLTLKRKKTAVFALCWFAATYLIWIPTSLITNRLTYEYYFYPAVSAVCIGIALLLILVRNKKVNNPVLQSALNISVPVYIGICILLFVFLYTFGSIWLRMLWAALLISISIYSLEKMADHGVVANSQFKSPQLKDNL
jgi:predicted membrane-bound dolichyl-phosphate-mannose-protein mannosyltransferase